MGDEPVAVVSPDAGGIKRAERFRCRFPGCSAARCGAFAEKYRSEGLLRGDELAGDVEGKVAIIVDDLVSAGRTIDRAAAACKRRGATRVFAAATHGVFAGEAQSVLEASPLERIVVTDTIADGRIAGTALTSRVERVSAAPVFAEAISRLHGGGSIAELLGR